MGYFKRGKLQGSANFYKVVPQLILETEMAKRNNKNTESLYIDQLTKVNDTKTNKTTEPDFSENVIEEIPIPIPKIDPIISEPFNGKNIYTLSERHAYAPPFKKFTVISPYVNWTINIQKFFYTEYIKELYNSNVMDEKKHLKEYHYIIKFFLDNYNRNRLYVDIGSNVGFSSIGLAKNGVNCICFEPIRENNILFRKSIIENNIRDNITLFECGLSDSNKPMTIYVPTDFPDNSSLNIDVALANVPDKYYEENIMVRTFDSFYSFDKSLIGLVKMDVQGFEIEVLRGMSQFFKTCTNDVQVMIEIDEKLLNKRNKTASEIINFMDNYGFYISDSNGVDKIFKKR